MLHIFFILCILLAMQYTSSVNEAGSSVYANTLTSFEDVRMREVKKQLDAAKIRVTGFFHMSRLSSSWKEVLREQLLLMSGFHRDQNKGHRNISTRLSVSADRPSRIREGAEGGLLSILHALNIVDARVNDKENFETNVTAADLVKYLSPDMGPDKAARLKDIMTIRTVPSVHRNKAVVDFDSNRSQSGVDEYINAGLSTGEYPTITALRDHCIAEVKANRQSIVFYAHLKSAGYSYPDKPAYWRDAMNAVVLEYPSICIRALMAGNSVCGMAYRTYPSSHFAGNFWWASCNHIAKLPPLRYPLFYWLDPEMFVMRVGPNDVARDFAKHCVYDAMGVDKDRQMFRYSMGFVDYSQGLYEQLARSKLKPCGSITHTSKLKIRSMWRNDMQEFSQACQVKNGIGKKDHKLQRGKPCLSLRTPPGFVPHDVNYYNIDSDPAVAWGFMPLKGGMGGVDSSDSSANFTRYIQNAWPLKWKTVTKENAPSSQQLK